jgi:hypothetical protein
MWSWPDLVLTDYERKFCRIYKTKDFPGVLRRVYKIVLNNEYAVNVDQNLPIERTRGQIQIARRSRVFALSFSGNLDFWRLNISNASGTQYTAKTSRPSPAGTPFAGQMLDPMVTSLLPSNGYNAESVGGLATNPFVLAVNPATGPDLGGVPSFNSAAAPSPLLLDPNWLLMPNETLIFNGTPVPFSLVGQEEETVNLPLTLTIVVHVWEYPSMGRASKTDRENM